MNIIKSAWADTIDVTLPDNPLGTQFDTAGSVFAVIMNLVFALSFVIALAFMLISGVKLAASGGDKLALQTAKKSFMWALIGTLLIVGARTLIFIIVELLGASAPQIPGTIPSF